MKPLPDSVIEILTVLLKPGTRDSFHQLYLTSSLPLQGKWEINVLAHGPSLHDENTYYVFRCFNSLEERQKKEDDFYGSDDWKEGPRSAILALIDHITTAVIPVSVFNEWALK